jgi:tetratricopeptide (TPR) repeat protein
MDPQDSLGASRIDHGAGAGDLIADIHRQQRRRVLRRAAQVTALAIVFLAIALALKIVADSRARAHSLDLARGHFARGTVVDLREAVTELELSLSSHPRDPTMRAALALVRAQQWLEFGEHEEAARTAVADVEGLDDQHDAVVASGMVAFADGDHDAATTVLERAEAFEPEQSIAPTHAAWLRGLLALRSDSRDERATAIEALGRADVVHPGLVAPRRLRALLQLQAGDARNALAELERARAQNRTHMGLAADEALYHAYLRQKLTGVADVADQLLSATEDSLGSRDRAHALLARGVVHVHSGETEDGLARIEQAWDALPPWDRFARELALQTVLEAGDSTRAEAWLEPADLSELDAKLYDAWAKLARGDIMGSLAALAEMPQDHPRVAYLQALALVEQLRFAEAGPWLDRADKLMPGLVELEVARARAEVRTGDASAALAKLQALAEEEAYAPRAWTGLGEAYLAQPEDEFDRRRAKRALERAIEREPVPAEALLRLAELWQRDRQRDPKAEPEALELLERAARTNPIFPRYRQALALELADLGFARRAMAMLRELADEPGVAPDAIVRLVRLEVEQASSPDDLPARLDHWLALAEEAGADEADLERERARIGIARATRESLEDARDRLRAVLEATPTDIEARVLFAAASAKVLRREEAELALRRGLQLSPHENHGRLYVAWARIESRTGKRQRAASHARLGWMRMLKEGRPPSELLDVGDLATNLWLRHGQPKVAMSMARELTSRLPFHSDAWTIRARTELRANRSADAQRSVERALDLDDDNPRAHEIHGRCLMRFGFRDRARAAYERALELAEGTPEEQAYRANLRRL